MQAKSLTIALVLTCAAGAALAQGRASTTAMNCHAAASLVQAQGAAVLGTGGDTFDRFVRDASFCPRGQALKPAFAPTSDLAQCQVGWRCSEESKENK